MYFLHVELLRRRACYAVATQSVYASSVATSLYYDESGCYKVLYILFSPKSKTDKLTKCVSSHESYYFKITWTESWLK